MTTISPIRGLVRVATEPFQECDLSSGRLSKDTQLVLFSLGCMRPRPRIRSYLNGLMLGSQPSRNCYGYVLGDWAIHHLFNELKFLINCIITPHQTFPNSLVHHMALDIKPPAWNQETSYLKSRRFRKDLPQGAWALVSCSLAAAYSVEVKSPSGFLERRIPVPSHRICARGSQGRLGAGEMVEKWSLRTWELRTQFALLSLTK